MEILIRDGNVYEEENTIEETLAAAESVFGTQANPTADKYYLVSNLDVNDVITNDIFVDVSTIIQNPINTTKIVDYFPEDITENFEFSYVGNPSVGTVSEAIDTETNTIKWDIGTLKGDETATLKYKLKIKDMNSESLLNKTIATNEKVVLTYKDIDAKEYTVTLDSSPKIQLAEVTETPQDSSTGKQDPNVDNTTAKGKYLQAGIDMTIVICIIVAIVIAIVFYKKYSNYKDIK